MTLQVVFRNAARTEFDFAALRYEAQRPGLGSQFVAEIHAALQLAATYPERFPIKHAAIRRAPVRRFHILCFIASNRGVSSSSRYFMVAATRAFGRRAHNPAFETDAFQRLALSRAAQRTC
jgi:hypothetical protein